MPQTGPPRRKRCRSSGLDGWSMTIRTRWLRAKSYPFYGRAASLLRTGEMSGQGGENFCPRVCGGWFIILEPMTETTHAGCQFRVVEGMVGTGVDGEIEGATAMRSC